MTTKLKNIFISFGLLALFFINNFSRPVHAYDPQDFVTRWKTDVTGATEPTKITLNFQKVNGTAYYQVSWKCDNNYETIFDAKYTYDYGIAGTYDICIKSPLTPLAFYAPGLASDEKTKLLEIKQWGNIKWSSFNTAFASMTNMKLTATDIPDLSAVTDMSSAFENTNFTGNESMNGWNTSNVVNMNRLFRNSTKFNSPIGNWNTSNVTNMAEMFYLASTFNQDITNWNLENVTTTSNMFYRALKFNNGAAAGTSNRPLTWKTGNVKNLSGMFRAAVSFNQPIGSWNTINVTNMERVFDGASVFNQALSNWNTSQVTTMLAMFQNAYVFNQNLNHFNTANVKDMNSMFWSATKFNQDISSWNIGNVKTFRNLLENTSFTMENYEKLLNKWSLQTVQSNVLLGAQGLHYCTAKDARDALTNNSGWKISDAGQNCPPHSLTLSKTTVNEHSTEVGYVSAIDDEASAITYTLVSGEGSQDNPKFVLDLNDGHLFFLEEPDFENPAGSADATNLNKYTIRVRAIDNIGLYSDQVFIITVKDIDDVAPIIQITPPASKVAKGPIQTTFRVSDRFSIASVKLDNSSVAAADIEHMTCIPIKNTSSTGFPYENSHEEPTAETHLEIECTLNVLTSGSLILKATDKAGYSSTAEEPGYVIDTLGPTFTIANLDIASSGVDNPTVFFKADDPTGVTKYEIYFNNQSGIGTSVTIPYDSHADFQSYSAHLDPDEDSHVIEIIAYDTTGNTTSRRITFPPVITINAPTIISNEPINDTTVKITTSNPDHHIIGIGFTGGASVGASITQCKDQNGHVVTGPSYNSPVTCEISGIQKTGMLEVYATETNGGKWTQEGKNLQKYFHDESAPNIIISAPTKAQNNHITDVTITITDNVDLFTTGISIHPDTTADIENNQLLCDTDDNDKSIVNCTLTITGSGDLVIEAIDKAGNSAAKTESNFIIDQTPPIVTIDDNLPKVNSDNQLNYILSGGCTTGDSNVIVTIGSQPHSTMCMKGERWNLPLNLSIYPDGPISLEVQQTDIVGHSSTATTTLQKDTVPLAVAINPANNQSNPTNVTPIKFTITFSKPINETTFTADDIIVTGSTVQKKLRKITNTTYELEINNITNGNIVTVHIPAGVITDLAGNSNLISNSTDNSVTYNPTASNSSDNNSNSHSDAHSPECHDQSPGKTPPVIYSAIAKNAHSILLSFRPADKPVEKYILQYGTKSGSYPYGSQNLGVNSSDSMTYAVNLLVPNTTYYFRLKAANGCATGDWSNEISATTKSLLGFNQLQTVSLDMTTLDSDTSSSSSLPSDCQSYVTKSGDTLWSIAKQLLGNGSQFQQIIDQNSDEYPTLKKNLLQPGWTLKINCSSIGNKDESSLESGSGLKVQVKVVDTKNNPIENAKVTIHSKVQEAWTNSEGIAEFNQVEPGDHKVIIDHDNYQGEQNINLSDNPEIKIHRLDIVVKKQKFNFSPWLILPVVIILLFLIYRRKREEGR